MHPILFTIGPLSLRAYGLMVALAFLAGLQLARWAGRVRRLPEIFFMDLSLIVILCGIAGARLMYVGLNASHFLAHPVEILKVWEGGLVFYGGFLGAALGSVIYTRKKNLPLGDVADCIVPALALGQAIGRLGCFLAGCCYGRPTSLPWAVQYQDAAALAPLGIDLHPVQIYESIGCLILAYALWVALGRYQRSNGRIFWIYVISYGALRFVMELLRGDDRGPVTAGLQPSQWMAIVAIAVGASILAAMHHKPKHPYAHSTHTR